MDETPGQPLLPRRQDPRDRRGHERDPAPRDRSGARPAGRSSRRSMADTEPWAATTIGDVTAPARGRVRRDDLAPAAADRVNIFLIFVCLVTAGGLSYVYSKVELDRPGAARQRPRARRAGATRPAPELPDRGHRLGRGARPERSRARGSAGRTAVGHDHGPAARPEVRPGACCCRCRATCTSPIDGHRDKDKINSAIQGGPERLINTIKDDFGIPINHYVEINFLAFRKIVAADRRGADLLLDAGPRPPLRARHRTDRLRHARPDPGAGLRPQPLLRVQGERSLAQRPDRRPRAHQPASRSSSSMVIKRAIDKGARNPRCSTS